MRYPYTGLYQYCLQLGTALLKQEKAGEKIGFYLPESIRNVFGKDIEYFSHKVMHKLFFPKMDKISVWHCTNQGSKYFPSQRDVPVVLTIHDLNFLYEKGKSKNDIKSRLKDIQAKITRANEVVAISSFVMEDILNHLSVSEKSINVIYNGCSVDEHIPSIAPISEVATPFLFTIGTILNKKNFHVLPPLLTGNDYKLVIAGAELDPGYKQEIVSEAKKWNVSERVIFTGPVSESEKKWFLTNCTAFVFPSIAEGFGLPVIEAMHFGKPVILSTHTSLPEIGGDCAYYFKSFDPDDMRETLQKSLEDFEHKQPATKVMERAREFSWEKAASRYFELYRGLY